MGGGSCDVSGRGVSGVLRSTLRDVPRYKLAV